jgi:hypothetical protein
VFCLAQGGFAALAHLLHSPTREAEKNDKAFDVYVYVN